MERDASLPSLDSPVSFRLSSVMTQYEHHVQEEEDIEDEIEDLEPEGQVQDSIAAHKPKKNILKSALFFDMVVSYALPMEIVEDSVPCLEL